MFRHVLSLTAAISFAALAPVAAGQEYLFSVPQAQMLVTVNPDASVQIEYDLTFQNDPRGHVIDVVDIGAPRPDYSLSSVCAWIGDQALRDVRVSTEVKPGFEVHLGAWTIPPGGSGRFRAQFLVPNMVYQDTTRSDYASLRITPTWFGERYVRGATHLQIAIQLPGSVKPDEVLHQGLNFTGKAASKQGALAGWDWPNVILRVVRSNPYVLEVRDAATGRDIRPASAPSFFVGVSFPKRDLQRVIRQTAIDLLLKWFSESTQARLILGAVFLALLGILFFRFSGGTGFSLYVVLAVAACVLFYFSPGWHLLMLPAVVVLIGLNEWLLGRRKTHYMPPVAQVEGGGIKRGLTAPEAAVLLELPVAKVLSLVIFGMLKKGVVRQVQADPLLVAVNGPFLVQGLSENVAQPPAAVQESPAQPPSAVPQAAAEFYGEAAVKQGVVVNGYEHPFLFLIQKNPAKPVRDIDFSIPIKLLIQGAAARMKGFDLAQTKDYYRAIIRKATEQAAAIGDIPRREQTIDRNFEWILMDDHFPTVFTYGRPYYPVWTRGSTVSTPTLPGGTAAAPGAGGRTSFGDVASSFAGWAENTMGNMASAISPGALSLPHPAGGFLDLSGADHVAGAFFQALADSATSGGGGGFGGGGGGCAAPAAPAPAPAPAAEDSLKLPPGTADNGPRLLLRRDYAPWRPPHFIKPPSCSAACRRSRPPDCSNG